MIRLFLFVALLLFHLRYVRAILCLSEQVAAEEVNITEASRRRYFAT